MQNRRGPGRPKNEERLARRREEILDMAAKVFARKGFPKTDLQVVADALGIGKGTVYRYFPSKHELFLAAADWGMQRLLQSVQERAMRFDDPLDQLGEGVRSYLAFFDLHPEFIELLMQERAEFRDRKHSTYFQHQKANVKPWKDFFRDLMRQGRIRKTRVDEVFNVLSDLLYGTIFTNHFAGRRERFEVQSRRILNVFFLGVLTDSERRRFRSGRGVEKGRP
ncbi:MAG: TetR/AcrR family transcriptional regulator [Pseudomonadota bacterium]